VAPGASRIQVTLRPAAPPRPKRPAEPPLL
jgi:hypothetical protein